uniref:Uncharacterized protein n=1 Tax=Globisporangium ultimum (strain ATCC 200006 / CBS 805.95 / DAOM BR144) TaxID=431595 RepID=K3X6V0_GLOUD
MSDAEANAFAPAFTSSYDDSDSDGHGRHHDGEDGRTEQHAVGYSAALVTGFAAGDARCATDLPEEDPLLAAHNRDSSHPTFDSLNELVDLPGKASTTNPVFATEFVLPKVKVDISKAGKLRALPVVRSASLPPPFLQDPEVPVKDDSDFALADVGFAARSGHSPDKIMETIKDALMALGTLEYKERNNKWCLEVSCLCVAEQINFTIQLSRLGGGGSKSDKVQRFDVAFHRTLGNETRFLQLTECVRSNCCEIDDEPLLFLEKSLDPWMDARREITDRRAGVEPKDAFELIQQMHLDLHLETLIEIAKEIKDHCRHRGNRKWFYQMDRKNFIAGLNWMLSSSVTELTRYGVFILLQFANDGRATSDSSESDDSMDSTGNSVFFQTPYEKSSFALLLDTILRDHEGVPCGKFVSTMITQVKQSWLFA